jgi:hypothetical protein
MDLKEIGWKCMVWINLAGDGDKWWYVMYSGYGDEGSVFQTFFVVTQSKEGILDHNTQK